ncbi:MAG: hypothetical protein HOV94_09830, partial [Saccharothrix sp.]|nr:hypothetical protein [Saccharothrix sp.]
MTSGPPEPNVENRFDGTAGVVVQAGRIDGDVTIAAPAGMPVPREVPPDVSGFTGRAADLAALDDVVARNAGSLTVITIAGMGGVGKTALAVHWANRRRAAFPDGDLFANLHGYGADAAVGPRQVLDGFLRALGVPAERVPATLDAQTGLYRSLLHDRAVLVVLDNVSDADQVRPLLPGSPRCVVLVTSRNRLSSLSARDGAHRVGLAPLAAADSLRLLARVVGDGRIADDPTSAAEITEKCAHLPLAIRITAERISSRRGLSLERMAGVLSRPALLLDTLALGGDELGVVRSVLSWSYAGL